MSSSIQKEFCLPNQMYTEETKNSEPASYFVPHRFPSLHLTSFLHFTSFLTTLNFVPHKMLFQNKQSFPFISYDRSDYWCIYTRASEGVINMPEKLVGIPSLSSQNFVRLIIFTAIRVFSRKSFYSRRQSDSGWVLDLNAAHLLHTLYMVHSKAGYSTPNAITLVIIG